VAAVCLWSTACGRQAPWYPPPELRPAVNYPDPGAYQAFIRMGSPLANECIVRDVDPGVSDWRWAFAQPQFKLAVPKGTSLRLDAELVIADRTFEQTGPVTLSCTINGKHIGSERIGKPGRLAVRFAVPEGMLKAGTAAVVDLVADKIWVAPTDGARLSYLLHSVGFVE
jgi:hypothetical protein